MVPEDVARVLRHEGYDVLRASEVGQARADDRQILEKAILEERILVTLDEHFGDWVVLPLSHHPGVIRLKAKPSISSKMLEILLPFLARHLPGQFKDRLVIVSPRRSRWIHTS
jgi:predicted nuclease of predicted toxin-antitoxin system